jgi:hypothetical protein
MFIFQLLYFHIAGREARIMQKAVLSITTKLILSQFLGNITCSYCHCYHSFNPAPYNLLLTVWHWRKAGRTPGFPTSVIICAHTHSIT